MANRRRRLVKSPVYAIYRILKFIHEGEIASHYVSLIALNAHPTFSRIAIAERSSVDMSPAQFAVLVTPARWDYPSPRADRQSLVGRRIVSALTAASSCWFHFCPDPYFATSDNGYVLGFVVFGNRISSLKLLLFPAPV